MKYFAMLLLFFPAIVLANSDIEAPKPKPDAERIHHFYDRPAKIELGAALALNTYDNVQTCRTLGEKTRPIITTVTAINGVPVHEVIYGPAVAGREHYLPTQSCAGVTLFLAGELAAQEVVAYTLHRTGHHKIERFVRFFTIEGNTQGIIYSARHR